MADFCANALRSVRPRARSTWKHFTRATVRRVERPRLGIDLAWRVGLTSPVDRRVLQAAYALLLA